MFADLLSCEPPPLESPAITRIVLLVAVLVAIIYPGLPAVAAGSRATPVAPAVIVSHDAFLAHSEPALAMDPLNHNNLLAASKMFTDPDHYLFRIGTYYSTNGGRTWHDNGALPSLDPGPNGVISDVSIAFGPGGTAYVSVLFWDGVNTSGVYVFRSRDGGKDFSPPVQVNLDTEGGVINDKPWITVDSSHGPNRGTIYVAWSANGLGTADEEAIVGGQKRHASTAEILDGIEVARSTDGGKTFSAPVEVATFDQDHYYLGAIPAVAPGGRLYVAFLSFGTSSSDINDGIGVVHSDNGGLTYSRVRLVARGMVGLPGHLPNSTFRNTSLPSFAISPRDGALVLTWADYRHRNADIMATTSTDRGKTWSAAVRVNHDSIGDNTDQFQPVIAVAPNGVLTCAWFDRRFDPNNRLIDEVVAQSTTDGRSWGHIIRVTARSWDPAIDAPRPEGKPTNTFIGDYQALAVDNLNVHPLWNDTGNGTSQQIRTATIGIQLFRR